MDCAARARASRRWCQSCLSDRDLLVAPPGLTPEGGAGNRIALVDPRLMLRSWRRCPGRLRRRRIRRPKQTPAQYLRRRCLQLPLELRVLHERCRRAPLLHDGRLHADNDTRRPFATRSATLYLVAPPRTGSERNVFSPNPGIHRLLPPADRAARARLHEDVGAANDCAFGGAAIMST